MGEAIISRSGGGSQETPIPITPGYHTIRVTLMDWNEKAVQNYKVACNDGTAFYEYTTNDKGQCLFVCNSGAANIHIRNVIDGVTITDIGDSWSNIDAPVGLTTDLRINLIKGPEYVEYASSKKFNTLIVSKADLEIIGGGGGGAAGNYDNGDGYMVNGGGGGAGGGRNIYNNISINRSPLSFVVGSGGAAGTWWNGSYHSSKYTNGNTGGTSYISNTEYSAIGGPGGEYRGNGGKNVGTGKGGNGSTRYNTASEKVAGMNSPSNFGGGGGRGGCATRNNPGMSGGSPHGGSGAWASSHAYADASSGTKGGGGGGGLGEGNGGRGGSGLMRLYLHY